MWGRHSHNGIHTQVPTITSSAIYITIAPLSYPIWGNVDVGRGMRWSGTTDPATLARPCLRLTVVAWFGLWWLLHDSRFLISWFPGRLVMLTRISRYPAGVLNSYHRGLFSFCEAYSHPTLTPTWKYEQLLRKKHFIMSCFDSHFPILSKHKDIFDSVTFSGQTPRPHTGLQNGHRTRSHQSDYQCNDINALFLLGHLAMLFDRRPKPVTFWNEELCQELILTVGAQCD